jgi:hypothetical protein
MSKMSHINIIEKYEELLYKRAVSMSKCNKVKFALKGDGEHISEAVWIIIAVALLLVSLGIYVYLGSKAEGMLLNNRDKKKAA